MALPGAVSSFGPRRRHAGQNRSLFLDDRSKEFSVDWETSAREAVSALRRLADLNPSDKALMALVGELATRSSAFRTWWGGHAVRTSQHGQLTHQSPGRRRDDLAYETLMLPSGNRIVVATLPAEPGTSFAEALEFRPVR